MNKGCASESADQAKIFVLISSRERFLSSASPVQFFNSSAARFSRFIVNDSPSIRDSISQLRCDAGQL